MNPRHDYLWTMALMGLVVLGAAWLLLGPFLGLALAAGLAVIVQEAAQP